MKTYGLLASGVGVGFEVVFFRTNNCYELSYISINFCNRSTSITEWCDVARIAEEEKGEVRLDDKICLTLSLSSKINRQKTKCKGSRHVHFLDFTPNNSSHRGLSKLKLIFKKLSKTSYVSNETFKFVCSVSREE